MNSAIDINHLELKANLLGLQTVRNDWGVAILGRDGMYRIWTELGEIPGKFFSVTPDQHFIVASTTESLSKKMGYQVFVRNTKRHLLGSARVLGVGIAYDLRNEASRERGFKGGDVALVTGLSRNYIVNSEGSILRVTKSVSYISLETRDNGMVIELHGHLFGSVPIGVASHDLTQISNTSLLI